MSKITVKLFLLIFLTNVTGFAYAQESKESVSSRIHNMEKLLNESSGARQVKSSSNSAVKQKHQEALKLYQQAMVKRDSGAYAEATKLLNQSTKVMFEAIKMATPASLTEDKNIINYEQRKQSVIALTEAFNRISDESNEVETKTRINRQLGQFVTKADKLLRGGNNTQARVEIDKAYHLLKVSIESIRSGQTLVRSLQFETKEEEYHYEVDRNDTHSMLISLLVDDRLKTDRAEKEVIKFVDEAKLLRRQADAYAGDSAFEIAIDLLEQSTRQLVRAIRSAGIYIPG